ncbi:MAG: hypothetical protein AAF608_13900 [Pseudomonadota bacterium]
MRSSRLALTAPHKAGRADGGEEEPSCGGQLDGLADKGDNEPVTLFAYAPDEHFAVQSVL